MLARKLSGHSQFDGPSEVVDLDKTEEYIQHNPPVGDGLDGLGQFLGALTEAGTSMTYKYVYKILAQGNFVVSYSLMQLGDEDLAVFDVFRLQDGKIVEHWDNMEPLPRGAALVNQGKF